MNEILVGLILSLGAVLLVGGLLWLDRQRKAQQTARLLIAAAERGWECIPLHGGQITGYHLRGTTRGFRWELETTLATAPAASGSGATSHQTRHTRWQSPEAVCAEGLVLVGPRSRATSANLPALESLGGLTGVMVRQALEWMLGEDAGYLTSLRELSLGSPALRARYAVWAHAEAAAQRLLTTESEQALTGWPAQLPLVVKISPRGLQIDLRDVQLLAPADLERLVDLGIRLVVAWQTERIA